MNKREYLKMLRQKRLDAIEDKNRDSIRCYCKNCGHTVSIPAYVDAKICTWCGTKVLNNSKAYFMRKVTRGTQDDL